MKSLILFSLKRKLVNKTNLFLFGLLLLVIGGLFFGDWVTDTFFQAQLAPKQVVMPEHLTPYLNESFFNHYENIKDRSQANIVIDYNHQTYEIIIDESISQTQLQHVVYTLTTIHQFREILLLPDDLIGTIDQLLHPKIIIEQAQQSTQETGFILITMVYFMMLGFSSTVANEVVSEKTSNVLEMMLTSITYKQHFISKIIIGWVSVLQQAIAIFLISCFWMLIRNGVDQGRGLYLLLVRIGWLEVPYFSFYEHLATIKIDLHQWLIILWLLLLLFFGIFLVQLLLLLISINIKNIEEASSLQAPFYLLLLGVYYMTLYLNTPIVMNKGLGVWFSFTPFLSMLFMPLRILYYQVSTMEVWLAILIAGLTLWIAYEIGFRYYKRYLFLPSKNKL